MQIRKQRYAVEPIYAPGGTQRIHAHPKNPRRGDLEAIEASIAVNGFYGSIICQEGTGLVLVGNHRFRVAVAKGAKKIPVTWVTCTDAEAERIALVDNKSHDAGAGYDAGLLVEQLQRIAAGTGSLDGTGYNAFDLKVLQAQAQAAAEEAMKAADALLNPAQPTSSATPEAAPESPPKLRALDLTPVVKGTWRIEHAQVLDALKAIPDNSVDAVLSDFPYGLGNRQPTPDELVAYVGGAELDTGGDFMGREWSVPSVHVYRELYRVLKPGGYIMGFAGSRTSDLITFGMRMAGFEVRDLVLWLYLSGFPKSQNVSRALDEAAGAERPVVRTERRMNEASGIVDAGRRARTEIEREITASVTDIAKAWDGFGTALKPAMEPCTLARKPLDGTLAQNVAKWGTGALNIDQARIGIERRFNPPAGITGRTPASLAPVNVTGYEGAEATGRWPANVLMDGAVGALLDEQTGIRQSQLFDEQTAVGMVLPLTKRTAGGYTDKGGGSRMFYCAKPSRAERDRGLEDFEVRQRGSTMNHNNGNGDTRIDGAPAPTGRNVHTTVKPVGLARYLATMLLPPPRPDGAPRKILVPYSGSGSDVIGALLAGWDDVTGIEREPQKPGDDDYVGIARARITHAVAFPDEWCKPADETEEPGGDVDNAPGLAHIDQTDADA